MRIRLLLIASVLSVISAGPLCPDDDGLYPNQDDRTTFIECIDGKENFRRCPRTKDSRSYQVFDGRSCVEPEKVFTCPQTNGLYRYLSDDKQYYECIESKPVLRKCPEDTIFDGLACVQPTGPVTDTRDTEPSRDLPVSRDTPISRELPVSRDTPVSRERPDSRDREVPRERPVWRNTQVSTPEFTCPRSSGVFRNPTDPYHYTYFECFNGVSTKRDCPSYTASRDGRYYQERMVFNGQNCVKQTSTVQLPRQPLQVADLSRYPIRRQASDYRCPGADGLYQATSDIQTWYECLGGEPMRVYTCEPGQVLDTVNRVCRGTTIRDEEVIVHKPETVVVETSPRVVELNRQVVVRQDPPVRDTYYPNYPDYYGRRYRRNGRVETEDQHTGSVIVDTWNEGAWRWDRNMNGQRLPLPLVNEWVDYGWRVGRAGYELPVQPVAEVRARPVEAVNYPYNPNYDGRYQRVPEVDTRGILY